MLIGSESPPPPPPKAELIQPEGTYKPGLLVVEASPQQGVTINQEQVTAARGAVSSCMYALWYPGKPQEVCRGLSTPPPPPSPRGAPPPPSVLAHVQL